MYKTCPVSLSMTIPYCPTILTSSPSAKTGTNDVKIIINDKVIVNNFLIIVFLPPYAKKITLFSTFTEGGFAEKNIEKQANV